ncbi:MAG: type II secretion system protein M [Gammaproteobacteria bacterium]|nr:type II secretion system protein M [Gammaproteobacteria bacterium]
MSVMTELTDKFKAMENREQKILVSGLIFVLLFIVYSMIYKPMTSSIGSLQKSNAENQQLRIWMAESVAAIKNSSGSKSNTNKRRGRSLNEVINSTASDAKISISRSQPRDNNQYQIWFDQIVFNELLVWLNVLQTDFGVYVSNINLGTTNKNGLVRVNLTFQDIGS